jgi:hypothetical protein
MPGSRTNNAQIKTIDELIDGSANPKYCRHALGELTEAERAQLQALAALLEKAGAVDPLPWAYSEVREGIAQTARFLVLRDLCAAAQGVDETLDSCDADAARSLYAGLLQGGADRASLDRLVLAIARSTVWHCVTAIDEGGVDQESPIGWALAETDGDGNLTGRLVRGLHESVQDEQFLGEF